jgi:hypothetical protein
MCLSLLLHRGVVGSIEEVAVGANASSANHKGWQLMACHTAPEFPEATAKDAITLGVLLGAGSFGTWVRRPTTGLSQLQVQSLQLSMHAWGSGVV